MPRFRLPFDTLRVLGSMVLVDLLCAVFSRDAGEKPTPM
jgi:hypothetical protein